MDATSMALRQSFQFPAFSRVPGRGLVHLLPLSKMRSPSTLQVSCSSSPLRSTFPGRPYTSVMIVPTGVGASIGGYAGDALPVARTLASVVDCLISHPNVMNAAMLYWPMPNTLYVEGYALDKFAEGSWALHPVHQNKIGYTFLPCVLAGLSRAPQYVVRNSGFTETGCILGSDVDSVVLPIDACGGDGALAFARGSRNKAIIIAVEENETVLNDTPNKLGIDAIKVSNYWEAIGVIAAHKTGVDPKSLRRRGIDNIRQSPIPDGFGLKVSLPHLHDKVCSY